MAQAGTKVVLLDCDMRKPRLHRMLGIRNEQGLSSTNIPNLDFIPAGLISPNPAELVGSERMQNLINELREEYGRIVIDSSPIAAVTDPVILSRLVDGVVLVIHAGFTSRDVIANAVVLNNVNIGKDSYYYYQCYDYYYGEKDGKKKKR